MGPGAPMGRGAPMGPCAPGRGAPEACPNVCPLPGPLPLGGAARPRYAAECKPLPPRGPILPLWPLPAGHKAPPAPFRLYSWCVGERELCSRGAPACAPGGAPARTSGCAPGVPALGGRLWLIGRESGLLSRGAGCAAGVLLVLWLLGRTSWVLPRGAGCASGVLVVL